MILFKMNQSPDEQTVPQLLQLPHQFALNFIWENWRFIVFMVGWFEYTMYVFKCSFKKEWKTIL